MQNQKPKAVKQWQAIYYPLACPVIAIKAVKSYLHGTERGTTGLKSVRRRSLIGCIDKVNRQERIGNRKAERNGLKAENARLRKELKELKASL